MSAYLEFDDKTRMFKSLTLEQWLEKIDEMRIADLEKTLVGKIIQEVKISGNNFQNIIFYFTDGTSFEFSDRADGFSAYNYNQEDDT